MLPLSPCPECKSMDLVVDSNMRPVLHMPRVDIICLNCGFAICNFHNCNEAVSNWNMRSPVKVVEDFVVDGVSLIKGDTYIIKNTPSLLAKILIFLRLKKEPKSGVYTINISNITASYGTGLEENPFINAVVVNTNNANFNGLYLSVNIPVVKYVKYSSSLEASFNEGNGVVIIQPGTEWVISSASADFYFGILSSSNIIYPWQTPWPEGVEVRQATVYDIQTWTGVNYNSLGTITYTHNTLDELINGEFSGSNIVSVTQSLIPNQEILSYPDEEMYYQISLFNTSGTYYASDFFDANLAPIPGEIYVLYDAGILFNPPGLEL